MGAYACPARSALCTVLVAMSRVWKSKALANSSGESSNRVELAWDELHASLSSALLTCSLQELDLPTRMRTFAKREGIRTVEDLVRIPHGQLIKERKVGRVSISRAREVLNALHLREKEGVPIRPKLDDFTGFFELWRHCLERLRPVDRMVLTHRAGLEAPALTLQRVGDMLNVTRERIRQIERRGIESLRRKGWWIEATEARLTKLLGGGALPLTELERIDPFFANASERWQALAYALNSLGSGRLHVIDWNGRRLLTRFPQEVWDVVYSVLVDRLRAATFPMARDRFELLVQGVLGELSAASPYVWERLLPLLRFSHDDAMVAGFGLTRKAKVAAHILGAKGPLAVSEIFERFGDGDMPDWLVYLEHGLVCAPHHLPDYELWAERLPPLCAKLMRQLGRERQTTTYELVEMLRGEAHCPQWLNSYTLSSILRQSNEVRHLGRQVVVLPKTKGERLQVRALVISILEEAGRPLPTSEIIRRGLERRGLDELTIRQMLPRAPFIQPRRGHFGLVERDLPGGASALKQATEALYTALKRQRRGLFPVEAAEVVRAISPKHRRWSLEMARSAARHDPRLQLDHSGGIGLRQWGETRVPNRQEFVAKLLAKNSRGIEASDLRDFLEAKYGGSLSAGSLGALAYAAGARRQNGLYVRAKAAR